MNTNHSLKRGFTLIEALIAITILLLVIIGPMTAAQKGTQNAYYAQEQLTAIFLAQEAAEAVRETRDNKALDVYDYFNENPNPTTIPQDVDTEIWAESLSECGSTYGCSYNPVSNSFEINSCGTNGCLVYYNDTPGGGVYTQETGSETPFHRMVRIQDMTNGAWRVTSKVSWKNERVFGAVPRVVELETWIYDQYQRYE